MADEKKVAEDRLVVLLTPPEGAAARSLALILAGRGHSLVLWPMPAPGGGEWTPEHALEHQLAIERAGGISLALTDEGLALAAEAFGRIETAVAFGRAAAERVARAAAALERARRPRRLIVWAAPDGLDLGAAPPQGMQIFRMPAEEGPEAIGRLVDQIEKNS